MGGACDLYGLYITNRRESIDSRTNDAVAQGNLCHYFLTAVAAFRPTDRCKRGSRAARHTSSGAGVASVEGPLRVHQFSIGEPQHGAAVSGRVWLFGFFFSPLWNRSLVVLIVVFCISLVLEFDL